MRRMVEAAPEADRYLKETVALNSIVRSLRHRLGLTLNDLADRSGLSPSTISKIEAGQLLPGYASLLRLAQGLEIEVSELFHPGVRELPTGRRSVTLKDTAPVYKTDCYNYDALASELSHKAFLPLIGTIKARSVDKFESLPSHSGEEFVYVLSGKIRLYCDYYEPLDLEPGDSVYFDSRSGHALICTSEEDAKVLWVCSDLNALDTSKASSNE